MTPAKRLFTSPALGVGLLSLAALALGGGQAAPPTFLNVATSPKGSTNSDMFRDLGRVCTSSAFLRQRQTSGSVENLELLLGNQVSLAFVQLDYLKAKEQIERDPRVKEIKQLLALNADEIHVIAPKYEVIKICW